MFFLQAAQTPAEVRIDQDRVAIVPLMLLEDMASWAAEISSARQDEAMKEFDEQQRAQFIQMFPSASPDINELKRIVATVDGAKTIVRRQLLAAKVVKYQPKKKTSEMKSVDPLTQEEVDSILSLQGSNRVITMAWALCQFQDNALVNPYPPEKEQSDKGGDNPLT